MVGFMFAVLYCVMGLVHWLHGVSCPLFLYVMPYEFIVTIATAVVFACCGVIVELFRRGFFRFTGVAGCFVRIGRAPLHLVLRVASYASDGCQCRCG